MVAICEYLTTCPIKLKPSGFNWIGAGAGRSFGNADGGRFRARVCWVQDPFFSGISAGGVDSVAVSTAEPRFAPFF
ncbi:MAG TPA: hypothetical protein VJ327_00570 [Patescibacteria group bacterium]|nr:hypothetical protein [Patescibacteria group bacterium]